MKLVKDLQDYEFEINPYDPGVVNIMINMKNKIVTWHIDNLKVSCKEKIEITKFILYL